MASGYLGGFGNFLFDPHPGSFASQQLLGNFEDAYNAFLRPYQQAFGGSSFGSFLEGPGRNYFNNLYEQQRSNELAGGITPEHVTSALDWLKALNPTQSFYNLAPQDRGESRSLTASPFSRYIGRF